MSRGIIKARLIPSKKERREYHAGKYIDYPELIGDDCHVTLRERGTEKNNGYSWWEHGQVYTTSYGEKRITTYDSTYRIADNIWDVYVDTEYNDVYLT